MPYINGNLKIIIAIGGFALSAVGGAVGYGKLNERTEANSTRIKEIQIELSQIAQDPDASATGARLRGEIKAVQIQLEDVKQQLNRIEAKLDRNSARLQN